MLYTVVCGSPAAGHVGRFVAMAQRVGWRVCVVTTPDGEKFVDAAALAAQTGFPVRSHYKRPGDPDLLPGPDAIVVAPATVNTVNKWACGIADTLALGMLVEGYGLGLPIVVMPYTNTAMAAHPAFRQSLQRLRTWGVRVLFGDDVMVLPPPGAGAGRAAEFPWQVALAAAGPPQWHRAQPVEVLERSARAGVVSRNHRTVVGGRPLAPPSSPRPAPAIVRSPGP